MTKKEFDAVVVGSGPNGLSAAIRIQQAGLRVLLIEGSNDIGGGLRTEALTLPGYMHDVCSAIHPMAVLSPFFQSLPLTDHGLEYIYPDIPLAHPFDEGNAVILRESVDRTAALLGKDENAYLKLVRPLIKQWPLIGPDVLAPLHYPKHPIAMAEFGFKALASAGRLSKRFKSAQARGLWAGLAAHSMEPLTNFSSSAIGLVLLTAAHVRGWPLPRRGSHSIARALSSYFLSLGGNIETGRYIRSLDQLPSSHAVLFDITPKQLLQIAGHRFSSIYQWQLRKFRYGMGVFKIDWALDAPIPFTATECKNAGTIHLGNTFEEIAAGEQQIWSGKHVEKPYVLLAQQSVFDPSRAPEGKHTAWAYCHVPNGSAKDMTETIELQVERFAPRFRERILARHTMNTIQLEEYNPNYIGGDINGGAIDIGQLFTRPALRSSPYRTSTRGLYICSSSTPPGGGVHGMCGYHAAGVALKDIFKKNPNRMLKNDSLP